MATQQDCTRNKQTANYKLKYKLLKRCIKEIVLENAALCDKASEMQHQILVAQEERKFLWKKYTTVQGNTVVPEEAFTKAAMGNIPTQEMKKQRKSTHKNGTSKPRQSLSKTKRKRKSEDSVSNDIAAFNSC